jgi:hypothetical protein
VKRSLHALLFALVTLLAADKAWADPFIVGHFTLTRSAASENWSLTARVPATYTPTVAPMWPEQCRETGRSQQKLGAEQVFEYQATCQGTPEESESVIVPWTLDGATLSVAALGEGAALSSTTLQNDSEGYHLAMSMPETDTRPSVAAAGKFLWLGVTHILTGWDHLCFVFCLCMLARGRRLVILVTAFTVGHSISLSLAFFGIVHIPGPPVEALIALSIALLAREAIVYGVAENRGGAAPDRWHHYLFTVAGFGLIHGLGFASLLTELGVSPAIRVLGLASFNVGVELGQLAFVLSVALITHVLRRFAADQPFRLAGLVGAGAIGWFWMTERLLGFVA